MQVTKRLFTIHSSHLTSRSLLYTKHKYLKNTDIVPTLIYNYSYYKMVIENGMRMN